MHVLAWNLFFPVFFLLFLRKFFFRPVFYLENIFSQALPHAFTLTKSQILNSSLPRGHESLFFGHGKRAPFFFANLKISLSRDSVHLVPYKAAYYQLRVSEDSGLASSWVKALGLRHPAGMPQIRQVAENRIGEPVALLIGANLT